mgnify:FL=1
MLFRSELIAPQSSWSLAVTNLEISYDGYENTILETGFRELKTASLNPEPEFAEFGFQNGDIAVVVNGTGGNVLVEYSDDFVDWYPLITIPNTAGIIQFNDPSSLEELIRFYRLKSFARPTAPPRLTLESGFGGDRGDDGGDSSPLTPLKIGSAVNVIINGEAAGEGDVVAIYVGEELRVEQELSIDADVAGLSNALVKAQGGEETISFRVYDASAGVTYEKRGTGSVILSDTVKPVLTLLEIGRASCRERV